MAIYNTTFMNNATNPVDIFIGLSNMGNEAHAWFSQYTFGYLILFSFFMVFLVLGMRYSFNEVIIVDGFLTTIIAILLYGVGMVQGYIIIWPAILMFLGLIFFFINK
jgi:hypothetical protein